MEILYLKQALLRQIINEYVFDSFDNLYHASESVPNDGVYVEETYIVPAFLHCLQS